MHRWRDFGVDAVATTVFDRRAVVTYTTDVGRLSSMRLTDIVAKYNDQTLQDYALALQQIVMTRQPRDSTKLLGRHDIVKMPPEELVVHIAFLRLQLFIEQQIAGGTAGVQTATQRMERRRQWSITLMDASNSSAAAASDEPEAYESVRWNVRMVSQGPADSMTAFWTDNPRDPSARVLHVPALLALVAYSGDPLIPIDAALAIADYQRLDAISFGFDEGVAASLVRMWVADGQWYRRGVFPAPVETTDASPITAAFAARGLAERTQVATRIPHALVGFYRQCRWFNDRVATTLRAHHRSFAQHMANLKAVATAVPTRSLPITLSDVGEFDAGWTWHVTGFRLDHSGGASGSMSFDPDATRAEHGQSKCQWPLHLQAYEMDTNVVVDAGNATQQREMLQMVHRLLLQGWRRDAVLSASTPWPSLLDYWLLKRAETGTGTLPALEAGYVPCKFSSPRLWQFVDASLAGESDAELRNAFGNADPFASPEWIWLDARSLAASAERHVDLANVLRLLHAVKSPSAITRSSLMRPFTSMRQFYESGSPLQLARLSRRQREELKRGNPATMADGNVLWPVARYGFGMSRGAYYGDDMEEGAAKTFCGTFYYLEPGSSTLLDTGQALQTRSFHTKTAAAIWFRDKLESDPSTIQTLNEAVEAVVEGVRNSMQKAEPGAHGLAWKWLMRTMILYMLTGGANQYRHPEYPDVEWGISTEDYMDAGDASYFGQHLYAQEDVLDQILCQLARKHGFHTLVFTHMAGARRAVAELLDARHRTESFQHLVYVLD